MKKTYMHVMHMSRKNRQKERRLACGEALGALRLRSGAMRLEERTFGP